jgi:hypothetical protein
MVECRELDSNEEYSCDDGNERDRRVVALWRANENEDLFKLNTIAGLSEHPLSLLALFFLSSVFLLNFSFRTNPSLAVLTALNALWLASPTSSISSRYHFEEEER